MLAERQAELARLRAAIGGADPPRRARRTPSGARSSRRWDTRAPAAGARGAGGPQLDPKDGIRFEMAIEAARLSLVAGRPAETIETLAPVLAADPGNAAALSLSGVALFATGRRDEGLVRLERAVAASGATFEYRLNDGAALYQAGRPSSAIEQFRPRSRCNRRPRTRATRWRRRCSRRAIAKGR